MAKTLIYPKMDGGLNLRDLDCSGMKANESGELKNLWWAEGMLQSRPGQVRLAAYGGEGIAAWEEDFHGWGIFHIADELVAFHLTEGTSRVLATGLERKRGTFVLFGGALYYKAPGVFLRVTHTGDDLRGEAVTPYIPTLLLNTDPESGAGDLYQSENRLGDAVRLCYTPKEGVTDYRLPFAAAQLVEAAVNGTAYSGASLSEDGNTVRFALPPAGEANSVSVVVRSGNTAPGEAFLACSCAALCGTEQEVCLVVGGGNAVFWSVGADASYFPVPYYNLCGDSGEAITGFGRQYGALMVVKEGSVGRLEPSVVEADGQNRLSLTYARVNDALGCDCPGTVCLIENNLVFVSSRHGAQMLRSASAAYENNLCAISRKVDEGLLPLLARAQQVSALDDGRRWWICAEGEVYLWDYSISPYTDPAWFYFTNVDAAAFLLSGGKVYHLSREGSVVRFDTVWSDFGAGIEKVCRFPARNFGTYERRKDILAVTLALRPDTDSDITVEYETDWGSWVDPAAVRSYSYRLAPQKSGRALSGRAPLCPAGAAQTPGKGGAPLCPAAFQRRAGAGSGGGERRRDLPIPRKGEMTFGTVPLYTILAKPR